MSSLNDMVLTDIVKIFTVSSPKGKFAKTNNRRCFGLSFCSEGQITYTHNGKLFVSDSKHVIILPKGQNYTLYCDKAGDFPVIDFECSNFSCDTIVSIPVEDVEPIIKTFEQMKAISVFDKKRAKLISLFYDIIDKISSNDVSIPSVLMPALDFLENNYASNEITNAILARKCKISVVYFRKLFTEVYGISPRQFIIDIRINKAKQLLTDAVLKVSAISEKCGFSNPYHFCRLFKQKVGITPSEFMRQNKNYKI